MLGRWRKMILLESATSLGKPSKLEHYLRIKLKIDDLCFERESIVDNLSIHTKFNVLCSRSVYEAVNLSCGTPT